MALRARKVSGAFEKQAPGPLALSAERVADNAKVVSSTLTRSRNSAIYSRIFKQLKLNTFFLCATRS